MIRALAALIVLALVWGLAGWSAPKQGIVLIWDSASPPKVALHRELSELMVRRRAAGELAGLGLIQEFLVYDFGQRPHARSLAALGVSRATAPVIALAQLDARRMPSRLVWKFSYADPVEASAALDRRLGIVRLEPPAPQPPLVVPPAPPPPLVPSPPPPPPDRLREGESLKAGEALLSPNGAWRLVCQYDGNCVIYHIQGDLITPVWNTATRGVRCSLTLSTDGKLRVFDGEGKRLWENDSGPEPGRYELRMQNDGGLVLWRQPLGEPGASWEPVWKAELLVR